MDFLLAYGMRLFCTADTSSQRHQLRFTDTPHAPITNRRDPLDQPHPGFTRSVMRQPHALLVASEYGHLDVINFLLRDPHTNINTTQGGNSALSLAVRQGHTTIVKRLLHAGADVDLLLGAALKTAAKYGNLALAKLLLDHKAVIDIQDINGFTDLMIAAQYGQYAMAELLLARGAHINHRSPHNHCCALLLAVYHGRRPIDRQKLIAMEVRLRHLIPRREIEHLHKKKQLFYMIYQLNEAIRINQRHMVKLLLDQGANLNSLSSPYHPSALESATTQGHADLVHLLLLHGETQGLQAAIAASVLSMDLREDHLIAAYWLRTLKPLAYRPLRSDSVSHDLPEPEVLISYHPPRSLWHTQCSTRYHFLNRAQKPQSAKDHLIRMVIFHGLTRRDDEPHFCQCLRLLFICPQATSWHPCWRYSDTNGRSRVIPQVLIATIATYLYHQDIITTAECYFEAVNSSHHEVAVHHSRCLPGSRGLSRCAIS